MLKSALLHPEILSVIAQAGHHATILIADGSTYAALDLSAAVEFASTASSVLDGDGELVLDMTDLAFMDSSGVRALLEVAMRTYRGVALRRPQPIVRKVLDITGIVGRYGIRVSD